MPDTYSMRRILEFIQEQELGVSQLAACQLPLWCVASHEELVAQKNASAALEAQQRQIAFFNSMDSEEIAPSTGLRVSVETLVSSPDGSTINIRYIRPDNSETLPCIYHIYGGRMEMSSCFEGNYKTWARMIAARGVAVASWERIEVLSVDWRPDVRSERESKDGHVPQISHHAHFQSKKQR